MANNNQPRPTAPTKPANTGSALLDNPQAAAASTHSEVIAATAQTPVIDAGAAKRNERDAAVARLESLKDRRALLGSISFSVPEAKRTVVREDRNGNKSRLVAQGFVGLAPAIAPNFLAPFKVYRRADKGARGFTITISFEGVAAGPGNFRSYFHTPSGKPADVTPAAAGIVEILRAEYDVWKFSPEAELLPAAVIEKQIKESAESVVVDGSIDEL